MTTSRNDNLQPITAVQHSAVKNWSFGLNQTQRDPAFMEDMTAHTQPRDSRLGLYSYNPLNPISQTDIKPKNTSILIARQLATDLMQALHLFQLPAVSIK